ncbi:MAG: HEAT repeat domain-containing protein [Myxococcales bacterium]|nr:HEAT repeat domain-containing protein [Myxococcales bacterium]
MPVLLTTLALALLAPGEPPPVPTAGRWPLWPSEVGRVAEPLHAARDRDVLVATEASKLQALRALERYPTELVADSLLAALDDRAVVVRREALQACLGRALLRCVPAAVTQWQAGATPDASVRIAAMRVLALDADTTPEHAALVLGALHDPDESIRAEAAHTLARVAWPKGQLGGVRTALIGKLGDSAPPVRRAAARSLGLLGPDAGAGPNRPADPAPLALARLLTDPDPQVRQDAAEALGALRDPRAAPPLIRAIEAGDEAYVSRAMAISLGFLPGAEVDTALLRLLDAPPRGLTYRVVAEALGRRPEPSQAVVDGLVARLREDTLQSYVLEALLLLGSAAAPALRVARDRGLEPPLDLAVRRLLAALEPPTAAAPSPAAWPPAADRDAWQRRLADPDALAAAAALAELAPDWLAQAGAHALARDHGPVLRRPWLLALAAASSARLPDDPVLQAQLAGWAADSGHASLDRCLALAVLARTGRPGRDRHGPVPTALARAAADRSPAVRACAAVLTRDPADLAGLMRDDSPRVRATAAFGLAACPRRREPEIHALLARLALRDPHPGVLRAAQAALDPPPGDRPCTWHLHDLGEPTRQDLATGWADVAWQATDADAPRVLRLPVHPIGETRWLLVPGPGRRTPLRAAP